MRAAIEAKLAEREAVAKNIKLRKIKAKMLQERLA